jgi:hypothetical protein
MEGSKMAQHVRDEAAQRLDAALVEQDRLGERYRAALGTSGEFAAYGRLRNASDEVAARDTRVKSLAEKAGGRVWVNGREVGGPGSLFRGLEDSHD